MRSGIDRQGDSHDLGMGEGRNTIFLAQQGWDATGIDISDVAVAQARQHAAKVHVNISAVTEDLDHYQLGTNKGTRPSSAQRLVTALKPGGLIILRYEDIEDEAEWAPGRGSHIIRLVAEKVR